MRPSSLRAATVCTLATFTLAAVLSGPAVAADPGAQLAATLVDQVTVGGIVAHMAGLERIAEANGGVRVSGGHGFDQSADYVAERLQEAGYQVTRQRFQFPFFKEVAPTRLAQVAPKRVQYRNDVDQSVLSYSANGTVQAAVHPVDVHLTPPRASSSGCQTSDFAGFPRGQVALLQRGSCEFGDKVRNAAAAGASAAIIFNQGNGDPAKDKDRFAVFDGTLSKPASIPAVAVTYAVGAHLATTPGAVVRVEARTVSENRTTQNLIAETPEGRADNVVMAGAHLDSVAEGPGINDNGSGSAALLELALKYAPLAKRLRPTNKVRFAWWGAEEEGLLGSEHYIRQLSKRQVADIGLYLNLDMLASPNYVFGVQDGNHSDADSSPAPKGSAAIEKFLRDYLTSRGQTAVDAEFNNRSDYGPFIAKGIDIPSGGLETGAEGMKSAADVKKFGGAAGVAYDPCYHKACDSFVPLSHHADAATYRKLQAAYGAKLIGNLNVFALDLNADALANAVGHFAYDTTGISTP